MDQITVWVAPYSSQMTAKMNDQASEMLFSVYLETIADLKWLSPQHIAVSRTKFNRQQLPFITDEMLTFGPKPAEMRKIIIAVQNEQALKEAVRLSEYQSTDWSNRDLDPKARARSALRLKLFEEFKILNTFDAAMLDTFAERLALPKK